MARLLRHRQTKEAETAMSCLRNAQACSLLYILTFRALVQSDRFDAAWTLVVADYRKAVSFPTNVLPFPPRRTSV